MRVIAGKYKGRQIEAVSGKQLRPTMGVAREALFNILSHGRFLDGDKSFLEGCKVLDLFCGCGTLSIEALSRGAERVVLIDIDQAHLNIARENLKSIGEEQRATFIRADSSSPPPARFQCNLVFIDPPYHKDLASQALKSLIKGKWISEGAIVIVETGKTEDIFPPEGFVELENRNYGNSRIRILEWMGTDKKDGL